MLQRCFYKEKTKGTYLGHYMGELTPDLKKDLIHL